LEIRRAPNDDTIDERHNWTRHSTFHHRQTNTRTRSSDRKEKQNYEDLSKRFKLSKEEAKHLCAVFRAAWRTTHQ
jgi:hypothetical protein